MNNKLKMTVRTIDGNEIAKYNIAAEKDTVFLPSGIKGKAPKTIAEVIGESSLGLTTAETIESITIELQ